MFGWLCGGKVVLHEVWKNQILSKVTTPSYIVFIATCKKNSHQNSQFLKIFKHFYSIFSRWFNFLVQSLWISNSSSNDWTLYEHKIRKNIECTHFFKFPRLVTGKTSRGGENESTFAAITDKIFTCFKSNIINPSDRNVDLCWFDASSVGNDQGIQL